MALVEPTRPQNPYWIWLSDNRAALEKEAGSKAAGVVGKLAGERWKALSADLKKPYEKKAEESKAAYTKAMEEFKAAGGEPGKRRQEKRDAKKAKVAKKEKKEARKNSGQPKKPPTGFWLWQTENREAMVKEAGTNKIGVLGKLAGEKWKSLSDAQKKPYETRAKEAKAEYEKAMAEWKASNAASEKTEEKDDGDEEEDEDEDEDEDEEEEEEGEAPAKKARTDSPKATPKDTKTAPVQPKKRGRPPKCGA